MKFQKRKVDKVQSYSECPLQKQGKISIEKSIAWERAL